MAKIDVDLRRHLSKTLRRVFRYSPLKRWAKEVHVTCVECNKPGSIEIDHRDPVVPVDREIGALEYFKRMFCLDEEGNVDMANLVGLCATHHRAKSKLEMALRAVNKTGPYSAQAKEKSRMKRAKTRAKTKAKIKIRLGRGKRKHVSSRRKKAKK